MSDIKSFKFKKIRSHWDDYNTLNMKVTDKKMEENLNLTNSLLNPYYPVRLAYIAPTFQQFTLQIINGGSSSPNESNAGFLNS